MDTPDNSRFRSYDYEPEKKKTKYDQYLDQINDNELNESLMGHSPGEFDEGEALNYHEDTYHPSELSKVHTDEELEKVVKELLKNSKRIDASDITVTVDNSNVTLSGSVKSQFERDYAGSVVKLVHGVGDVHTDLIVKINPGILPTDIGRNP